MNRLKQIMEYCKCGVYVEINRHKDSYISTKEELETISMLDEDFFDDVGKDVYNKMIELDIIIHIQCYPNTPIGSYSIHHYDLDDALDIMLHTLQNNCFKQ